MTREAADDKGFLLIRLLRHVNLHQYEVRALHTLIDLVFLGAFTSAGSLSKLHVFLLVWTIVSEDFKQILYCLGVLLVITY